MCKVCSLRLSWGLRTWEVSQNDNICTFMVPVITDSIVVAVVVGGSNSLQLFCQQVSMKPGCDGQHPASVTPHIDVHLWHLGEIQLYRRYGFISSVSQQTDETRRGAELFCGVSTKAGCSKYSTNSNGPYWSWSKPMIALHRYWEKGGI